MSGYLPLGDLYTGPDLEWIPAGLAKASTTRFKIALTIHPVRVAVSTAT